VTTEFIYPGQLGDDCADCEENAVQLRNESWLCWDEGQIYTKNPEPEFIDKIVVVAKSLGAKVQGDEGEVILVSH
jgi:hypothetical protein